MLEFTILQYIQSHIFMLCTLYIASENETMHYLDFLNSKHPYMNITQRNVFLYVHVE